MTQAEGQCASQHTDYYVMLSKHIDCEFSKVSAIWLEISPTPFV